MRVARCFSLQILTDWSKVRFRVGSGSPPTAPTLFFWVSTDQRQIRGYKVDHPRSADSCQSSHVFAHACVCVSCCLAPPFAFSSETKLSDASRLTLFAFFNACFYLRYTFPLLVHSLILAGYDDYSIRFHSCEDA